MQYLIGAAITMLFFLCLGLAFYCGIRFSKKAVEEVDQKKKLEIQRKIEGMQNIMNYDINVAMGVKHEHQ